MSDLEVTPFVCAALAAGALLGIIIGMIITSSWRRNSDGQ